jgi:hypothetical protein
MAKKTIETIPVQGAIDNLAAIAAIDLSAPGPLGIIKKARIVTDEEAFPGAEVEWLSGEGSEVILEVLDQTWRSIHDHLIRLLASNEMDWGNERSVQAIASLMALVGESTERLEKYLEYRMGKTIDKITNRPEYRALQEFYQHWFLGRIKSKEPHEVTEGIADMEAVRSDRDYELFYIRHEDGAPYFNLDLLRHMRLISDFESEGESFEYDPLLQVRSMMDRDLQTSANQILTQCHRSLEDFYKNFQKLASNDLALTLSNAVMALFLSANPRNLMQNTTGKTSLSYFEDFHRFLRLSFKTPEYQRMIAYPPEKTDKMASLLLHVAHALSAQLFYRAGGVKQEAIGLIHRTARRGTEKDGIGPRKGETIWNQILFDDENYRSLLAKFPSGPLLKILDLIRSEETETVPFDPIAQGNFPMKQYTVIENEQETAILHIPSPTRQTLISKVEIVDEFRGLLRFYQSQGREQKHLLINLQDRTSWKEFARTKALEAMQKNAEFSSVLVVFTLPKATDFYYQNKAYLNVDQASDFFAVFLKQLETPEECGFGLPSSFSSKDLHHFAEGVFPLIHAHFFEKKSMLTQAARIDFIEIFNQFLILKLLERFHPTSVSFTCKDAVDTGAAQTAELYVFLKLLNDQFKTKEEQDYFRWLLYCPALFVRERAIDSERFHRMLSGLDRLERGFREHSKAITKKMEELYHRDFLKTLKISD